MNVIKKNGKKQKFSKAKVAKGCVKCGATKKVSVQVANVVARKTVEGLSTRRVGELALQELRKRDRTAALKFNSYFNKQWK